MLEERECWGISRHSIRDSSIGYGRSIVLHKLRQSLCDWGGVPCRRLTHPPVLWSTSDTISIFQFWWEDLHISLRPSKRCFKTLSKGILKKLLLWPELWLSRYPRSWKGGGWPGFWPQFPNHAIRGSIQFSSRSWIRKFPYRVPWSKSG